MSEVIALALAGKWAKINRLLRKGVSIDSVDADGFTALGRVAIDALARRVPHWHSEGDLDGVPVSYTVTDGVMVFRKRGKPAAMSFDQQLMFSKRLCREFHAYLEAVSMCSFLIHFGASLTHEDGDGVTTLARLQALGHPHVDEAIADQPRVLEKMARRARGEARRAAASAARDRRLKKLIAKRTAEARARTKKAKSSSTPRVKKPRAKTR